MMKKKSKFSKKSTSPTAQHQETQMEEQFSAPVSDNGQPSRPNHLPRAPRPPVRLRHHLPPRPPPSYQPIYHSPQNTNMEANHHYLPHSSLPTMPANQYSILPREVQQGLRLLGDMDPQGSHPPAHLPPLPPPQHSPSMRYIPQHHLDHQIQQAHQAHPDMAAQYPPPGPGQTAMHNFQQAPPQHQNLHPQQFPQTYLQPPPASMGPIPLIHAPVPMDGYGPAPPAGFAPGMAGDMYQAQNQNQIDQRRPSFASASSSSSVGDGQEIGMGTGVHLNQSQIDYRCASFPAAGVSGGPVVVVDCRTSSDPANASTGGDQGMMLATDAHQPHQLSSDQFHGSGHIPSPAGGSGQELYQPHHLNNAQGHGSGHFPSPVVVDNQGMMLVSDIHQNHRFNNGYGSGPIQPNLNNGHQSGPIPPPVTGYQGMMMTADMYQHHLNNGHGHGSGPIPYATPGVMANANNPNGYYGPAPFPVAKPMGMPMPIVEPNQYAAPFSPINNGLGLGLAVPPGMMIGDMYQNQSQIDNRRVSDSFHISPPEVSADGQQQSLSPVSAVSATPSQRELQRQQSIRSLILGPMGGNDADIVELIVPATDTTPYQAFPVHHTLLSHFSPYFHALLAPLNATPSLLSTPQPPITKPLTIKVHNYNNELEFHRVSAGPCDLSPFHDNNPLHGFHLHEWGDVPVEVVVKLPKPDHRKIYLDTVTLGPLSATTMHALLNWLYLSHFLFSDAPCTLIALWILASRLGIRALQNDCIVGIENGRKRTGIIETGMLRLVYDNTGEYDYYGSDEGVEEVEKDKCGLRNLLMDQCVWFLDEGWLFRKGDNGMWNESVFPRRGLLDVVARMRYLLRHQMHLTIGEELEHIEQRLGDRYWVSEEVVPELPAADVVHSPVEGVHDVNSGDEVDGTPDGSDGDEVAELSAAGGVSELPVTDVGPDAAEGIPEDDGVSNVDVASDATVVADTN